MNFLLFSSKNCQACDELKRKLKKLKINYEEKNINDKDNIDLISKYHIRSIPTLIVLKYDQPQKSIIGNIDEIKLQKELKETENQSRN